MSLFIMVLQTRRRAKGDEEMPKPPQQPIQIKIGDKISLQLDGGLGEQYKTLEFTLSDYSVSGGLITFVMSNAMLMLNLKKSN